MKLAAVILAGGQSQRMGQDKALLELGGISLLRRTWEVAHSLTPDVRIVTSRRDRYQSHLPATAQWLDEAAPAGPLVAFHQALLSVPAASADWLLLLACDLPNLQAEPLRQWSQTLTTLPAEAIAYVPKTQPGWEPLCGFYRHTCVSSLSAYLATGQRSFQRWLDQSTAVAITDVPVGLLANCNTPADWQRLTQP
jgi:molybdopterin-guanine dinucleotide biosynthesis protein A